MTETITLRLVVEGEDTVTVDRAEYELAKALGALDILLDVYICDVETETTVVEPDDTCVLLAEGGLVLPPPAPVYLIWTNRWSAWRGQDGGRYGGDVWSAGRFSEAEARTVIDAITWPEGEPPPLVMVLAPEHGRMPFAAGEIRHIPGQMRRAARAETRRRVLDRQIAGRDANLTEGVDA